MHPIKIRSTHIHSLPNLVGKGCAGAAARLVLPLLILLLFGAGHAFAQDAQPEPDPTAGQVAEHDEAEADHGAEPGEHHAEAPSLIWSAPFVTLLLCIAFLPLIPRTELWWEKNGNKLLVAGVLALTTSAYYFFRPDGFHGADPGKETILSVLNHAVIVDYIPFIVLLFSLFTISGGIYVGGDIPAHPRTNVLLLLIGASIASFIGTTGASMLLIRPLLQINSERRYVKHSVVFFIFLVSNIGGTLLPIGDPPLFLGYLRGVPFLWTLGLFLPWLVCVAIVLGIYWVVDEYFYRKETARDIARDETVRVAIKMRGGINFVLLGGVILAVAFLVPGRAFPGTNWEIPKHLYLRELAQLVLAGISMLITHREIRKLNGFSFLAINEVACLFIGIFITMQVPIEILSLRGSELGLTSPAQFFWATGGLSAFLDNAPTYVVFFSTAGSLPVDGAGALEGVATATGSISTSLLVGISLGSVFMGAMTYIGNGPNFMVKSIAEAQGIKMPSFFGYVLYSSVFLLPAFAVITWLFLV